MRSLPCYLAKHHVSSHSSLSPSGHSSQVILGVSLSLGALHPVFTSSVSGSQAFNEDKDKYPPPYPRTSGIYVPSGTNISISAQDSPHKAHMPVFSCKLLPQRYYDNLFLKYFHLQSPSFQNLNAINLSGFHQLIPSLPSTQGRWGMESQAVCPKHACPTPTIW